MNNLIPVRGALQSDPKNGSTRDWLWSSKRLHSGKVRGVMFVNSSPATAELNYLSVGTRALISGKADDDLPQTIPLPINVMLPIEFDVGDDDVEISQNIDLDPGAIVLGTPILWVEPKSSKSCS